MKRIATLLALSLLARPCGAEDTAGFQGRCDAVKLRAFFAEADGLSAALAAVETARAEPQKTLVNKYASVIHEQGPDGAKKWVLRRVLSFDERKELCPKGGTVWKFTELGLGMDDAAWNAQPLKIQVNILLKTNDWYKILDRKMLEVKRAAEAVYKAAGSEGLGAVKSEDEAGEMPALADATDENVAVNGPNFQKETTYIGAPSLEGLEGDAKKRKLVAYYDKKFKLLKSLVEEVEWTEAKDGQDPVVNPRKPGLLVKTFYAKVQDLQNELAPAKIKAAINPIGVAIAPLAMPGLADGLADMRPVMDRKMALKKLAECTGWLDKVSNDSALSKVDMALRNQVCMHAQNVETILDILAKTVEAADVKTIAAQETAANVLINTNLGLDSLKLDLTKTLKGRTVKEGIDRMGEGWARSEAGLEAATQWEAAKTEAQSRMKTERTADGKYRYFEDGHQDKAKIYDSLEALEADTRGRAELVEGVAEGILEGKSRLKPMLQAVRTAAGRDGRKYESQDYDAKKAFGPCSGETEEEMRKRLEDDCRGDSGDCAAAFDAAEKTYGEEVEVAHAAYEAGEQTQAREREHKASVDEAVKKMKAATKDCGGDREQHAAKVAACAAIAAKRAGTAFNKEVDGAVQEIKENWLADPALAKNFLAADSDKTWLTQSADTPAAAGHTNLHQYFKVNWETSGDLKTANSNRCRGYLEAGDTTGTRAAEAGGEEKSFETCVGEILAGWAPTQPRAQGATPEELRRRSQLYQ